MLRLVCSFEDVRTDQGCHRSALMCRRLKKEVLDQLPAKHRHLVNAPCGAALFGRCFQLVNGCWTLTGHSLAGQARDPTYCVP